METLGKIPIMEHNARQMTVKRRRYSWLHRAAIRLRRFSSLHRIAKWFRRNFLQACREAVLEFGRWIWADSENFGPPQYAFSVYQMLRAGDPNVRGRIILEDQGSPVVSADSLMAIGGYDQHLEQPWPIFWSEHPEARLVAESLALLRSDKRVCLESVYGYHRLRHDPAFRFFRLPPPVRLAGNWTSLVSRWIPTNTRVTDHHVPNHTHWLLDALPRLALLNELPADTRIIVPSRLAEYQKESLALMGLWDRCRPSPEHHLKIERYFFSSPTSMLECYNPYAIKFLRETFLPKRDQTFHGPKRFFIRRSGLYRDAANALELEEFFAAKGWEAVSVEKLTFAQEIQLFAEAEAITGLAGSGFTNTVFCPPGCRVVQICPNMGNKFDGYLDWIQQVVGYDLRNIIVPCPYDLRQYRIDLDHLGRELEEQQ